MARLLYRLGRLCHRRRLTVLAIWLLLLAGTGALAAANAGKTSDEFRVPGTEAQAALDRLGLVLPEFAHPVGQVVFTAPQGRDVTAAKQRRAIKRSVAAMRRTSGVMAAVDPYTMNAVSRDRRTALGMVVFGLKAADLGPGPKNAVRDAAAAARRAGLQVEFGGNAYTPGVAVEGGDAVGVGVAVVVLLLTFGSVVAAGLPLASALFGVGVGMAGILALTGPFKIVSTAPVLALMIGTAVGIDYALFIVSRHRQNLAEGMDSREAAATATATAGTAVVFAGATVIAALAGLAVADVPFLTVMGLAAAGAVAIALLAAITLLPALIALAGNAIRPSRKRGGRRAGSRTDGRLGQRVGSFIVRRPLTVLLASLVVTGVLAIPAKGLRLGLPSAGSYPESTTARKASDLVDKGFGPGFNGPLIVVLSAPGSKQPGRLLSQAGGRLQQLRGVAAVLPPSMDRSGRVAAVPVIPTGGPDSQTTEELVSGIRGQRTNLRRMGVELQVSGETAANIDVADRLGATLPRFLLVITGIALILLTLAFRSLLIPVKAVISFLLSIAATAGAVVAVYQQGWFTQLIPVSRAGPVLAFLPILVISVLFGLAMDYELFLVSRMKEAHDSGTAPRDAVVAGFASGSRVVTAAALIMISVFGSFAFGPDPVVQPIGFALAVGVVVDAFVVRLALVPAVMTLLGEAAWWFPRLLERIVPRVEIEGDSLPPRRAGSGI